ncbi:hypothetical protein KQS06HV_91347 [Klebsiella quasipneumoniae subsp. similipneumoniae]|nr:hypothetical protein KQS06HV_91347 [Klebsiella quasipneumoniae subsp. similipneumoniae]
MLLIYNNINHAVLWQIDSRLAMQQKIATAGNGVVEYPRQKLVAIDAWADSGNIANRNAT